MMLIRKYDGKDIRPHITKLSPIDDDDDEANDDDDDDAPDDDDVPVDDDDDEANDDDDDYYVPDVKPFQGWTGVPISLSTPTLRR